jgi:F-type H+-transporting ATPase subunit gamma
VEGPEAPGHPVDYLYEPKRSDVLERLIPHCLEVIIKRLLLEANLSEHATRMLAMDNAMKNAADMIDQLTLSFNKARQLAITQELSEIVTANEAMKEVVK